MVQHSERLDERLDDPDPPPYGPGSIKSCEERLRNICILMRTHNGGQKPRRAF
jgi:hypothetical protein